MKITLLLLNLLCFFLSPLTAGEVIIIMGASCSGKSTLSKKFLETLEGKWQFVELDEIEDNFKIARKDFAEIELLQEVVSQANYFLKQGWNVIIDTNIYHEILRTISTKNKIFILIHCPLNILLERNTQRDIILQRSPQRAAHAKRYVEKTFHNFENFNEYDILVDSERIAKINPLSGIKRIDLRLVRRRFIVVGY